VRIYDTVTCIQARLPLMPTLCRNVPIREEQMPCGINDVGLVRFLPELLAEADSHEKSYSPRVNHDSDRSSFRDSGRGFGG